MLGKEYITDNELRILVEDLMNKIENGDIDQVKSDLTKVLSDSQREDRYIDRTYISKVKDQRRLTKIAEITAMPFEIFICRASPIFSQKEIKFNFSSNTQRRPDKNWPEFCIAYKKPLYSQISMKPPYLFCITEKVCIILSNPRFRKFCYIKITISYHPSINGIVKLLKKVAYKQRKSKHNNMTGNIPLRHINVTFPCVFLRTPSFIASNIF